MDSLENLVEKLNRLLGLPNLESYAGDIVTALTPNKWRTKEELDGDVEKIRRARFDEKMAEEWLTSPGAFFRRHIVGRHSSPLLVRKALKSLVKEQFVIYRARTVQPGIIVREVGRWEYSLHPTRRIQVDGGKRARAPAALVVAPARVS
jgi:hypothetical protein